MNKSLVEQYQGFFFIFRRFFLDEKSSMGVEKMTADINQNIITFLRSRQDEMTGMLEKLVQFESPNGDKPSLES